MIQCLWNAAALKRRTFLLTATAATALAGQQQSSPLYLLTYDHGGLVLWGTDHFAERLRDAVSWLERYPGFKIGLDNEAYTYDFLAAKDPELLAEIRRTLQKYSGRFGIGSCTYGQPLSTFINEESNIRQIYYALDADQRHFGRTPEGALFTWERDDKAEELRKAAGETARPKRVAAAAAM